ncbi:hypothetical protein MANES_01G068600v8 [Manihot esculenta]|uniref:Uncharacterized protein n=1 Tax=Manihot esculenta TaxID=3983 RepID=A0A2C9WJT1_MANES|nr:hypothetical protein MANES_01G068600v8 [Manihot esculenta]
MDDLVACTQRSRQRSRSFIGEAAGRKSICLVDIHFWCLLSTHSMELQSNIAFSLLYDKCFKSYLIDSTWPDLDTRLAPVYIYFFFFFPSFSFCLYYFVYECFGVEVVKRRGKRKSSDEEGDAFFYSSQGGSSKVWASGHKVEQSDA